MSTHGDLLDLAAERMGASVLYANDDFFAPKENLLKEAAPLWLEHEYTDRGKWMDGWESRRRRTPGHDFAIVRLGARGVVRAVVVDTSFFRGNYPDSCSIDGLSSSNLATVDELLNAAWQPMLAQSKLKGDTLNELTINKPEAVTHLRFNIFPDGGVARLRVFGEVVPDWHSLGGLSREIDLAAADHGGQVHTCSDMFFGPKHNLIMPGRARNMSDGWETRRRRGPGHDWVIVELVAPGVVHRVEIDTNHFKGNYPDTASIEGSMDGKQWNELLPRTRLQAHTRHLFVDQLSARGPHCLIRLNVFPDGGVSRLRIFGSVTEEGRRALVVRHLNTLFDERLREELRSCCGSSKWVEKMASARPYRSWESLLDTSERVGASLEDADWKEAFAAHPRIGEKREGARWSAEEQSGTRDAGEDTMREIQAVNREYEQRFGHLFLIRATGMTAAQMLQAARRRLQNDPQQEMNVAAAEQQKITALRLEKLVL